MAKKIFLDESMAEQKTDASSDHAGRLAPSAHAGIATASSTEPLSLSRKFSRKSSDDLAHYRRVAKKLEVSRLVIFPDTMPYWDTLTGCALLFTALFAPYEVAMIKTQYDALFFVNRVIDAIFCADMVFCFFTAYFAPAKEGGRLVTELARIRRRYLRTWWLIDMSSWMPIDWFALIAQNQSASRLRGIRLVRMLRLLKLMRVVKASRIYKRVEEHIAIQYAYMQLIKFFIILLLAGHWFACLWVLAAELQGSSGSGGSSATMTWLGYLELKLYASREIGDCAFCGDIAPSSSTAAASGAGDNATATLSVAAAAAAVAAAAEAETLYDEVASEAVGDVCDIEGRADCYCAAVAGALASSGGGKCLHHSRKYVAAFYWAIVTITSVGYGDVCPVNSLEMFLSTIAILFGAALWAYLIGSACSTLAMLDVETVECVDLSCCFYRLPSVNTASPRGPPVSKEECV